ncbi:uncharacterized protein Dere_GG16304 [Drosophila erecta]|nr:uncharacterized protein Dere_GG16304 [Drosophila erecta]
MGWLSTTFGIILLTLLFTIWISAHPRWDQVAKEVASKMNYNEPDRIQKATKAAKKAETKIYDFYVRKLENQKKVAAREILDNAYFETRKCMHVCVKVVQSHLGVIGRRSFQLPVPDSRLLPLAARGDSFDNRMYRNRKRKDQCQEQQQLIPEFKPE